MIKKPQKKVKIKTAEIQKYQYKYYKFFLEITPKFKLEIEEKLFPLYLEIFGSHRQLSSFSYEDVVDAYLLACDIINGLGGQFNLNAKMGGIISDASKLARKCEQFKKELLRILKKYKLSNPKYSDVANNWLAARVYCAVCLGDASVNVSSGVVTPGYPEELLNDLWKGYDESEWIQATEKRYRAIGISDERIEKYKENPFRPLLLPPAKPFQFFEFDVRYDVDVYEKAAIEAYVSHFRAYLKEIKSALKKHGFKRYKPDEYNRVHWLVLWNKSDVLFLTDVVDSIKDYCDVKRSFSSDNIETAFKEFKELNLPIRPYGKSQSEKLCGKK